MTIRRSLWFSAALLLLSSLVGACEEEVSSAPPNLLSIAVFSPGDALYNPWSSPSTPVAAVKVSVSGDQIATTAECAPYAPGSKLLIPPVPYNRTFQVCVELYGGSAEPCGGELLARGSSRRLDLKEGSAGQTASILVSRVGRFSPTASQVTGGQPTQIAEGRYGSTATVLPDGRVVVIGGARMKADKAKINPQDASQPNPWAEVDNIEDLLTSVELYNPDTGTFETLSGTGLFYPRAFHQSVYIPSVNKIAVFGGVTRINGNIQASNHVEFFDPESQTVLDASLAPPLVTPRWGSSATLLDYGGQNQFVLIAGGKGDAAQISYEVWSPSQGVVRFGPSKDNPDEKLVGPRWNHVAVPVEADANGRPQFIFLIGGEDETKTVSVIDVFRVKDGVFLPNGEIPNPLEGDLGTTEGGRVGHQVVYVPSKALNAVYVIGGYHTKARNKLASRIEVINTKDGKSEAPANAGFNLCSSRALHEATLMDGGRILITGGITADGKLVPGAEVIGAVQTGGGASEIRAYRVDSLIDQRFMHNTTYLPNDYALVLGGLNSVDLNLSPIQSTELFTYDPSPVAPTAGCQ